MLFAEFGQHTFILAQSLVGESFSSYRTVQSRVGAHMIHLKSLTATDKSEMRLFIILRS